MQSPCGSLSYFPHKIYHSKLTVLQICKSHWIGLIHTKAIQVLGYVGVNKTSFQSQLLQDLGKAAQTTSQFLHQGDGNIS